MNTWLALAPFLVLVVVLVALYRPVGAYLAHVYTDTKDWRLERGIYRLTGVDSRSEQSWQIYLRGVLVLSLAGVLLLYLLQRTQQLLPMAFGMQPVPELLAFNTAVSFVTNTNWQNYSPEQTLGMTAQMLGLTVQNFVSAAVGIGVAIAVVRGFARARSGSIGNFWVDLVRGTVRVLVPMAFVSAIILVAGGVVQNFINTDATTLAGVAQTIPGGPVASQEAIKELGTNGGGYFNANSAHPLENPTAWVNFFQIVLMLVIPFSLPRAFGKMVGSHRQGYAIVGVMGVIYTTSTLLLTWVESQGAGAAAQIAGAAMEGKEQRFGIVSSTLFASTSTLTSTGAVNSMHDSYTALGGMFPMINMMLGEVAPGGVGSGLYGMLVLAILAVFISGLLVGRTPEYLGKRIGPTEIKLVSLYVLVTPVLVLVGTALSFAIPAVRQDVTDTSILNVGPHGLSEVLYALTSAANNNGSAFAGLTGNTPWFNVVLAIAMLLGRFIPIVLVLALAGSLAQQDRSPATAGTLPTDRPQFVGLLVGVTIIVTALTYFPVLTLGPLAEGLPQL